MSDDETVRVSSDGQPIRGIRVQVRKGPDAGTGVNIDNDALSIGTAPGNDLVLTDPTVSRIHVTLGRRGARIAVTDHDSTNGTHVGPVAVRNTSVAVRGGSMLQLGETSLLVDDGRVVMVDDGPEALGDLRGRDPSMRRLMATIGQMASAEVPVLILGESGTGKELIARAIHDHGPRRDEPFVTVDCAAMTPNLFASELFGHEKGAFTGADRQHVGACERAHGGTLFLDEIGELPLDMQAALLGVLERRKVRRVGGRQDIPIDIRLVSATNRDLYAGVNAGTFRLDLFYRIAVVRLDVPALRDRRDDIPLLVAHFLEEAGYEGGVAGVFDEATLALLQKHSWPGNVRELRNVVLGTLALGQPAPLSPSPMGAGARAGDPIEGLLPLPYREAKRRLLEEFETRYVSHRLGETGGNIKQAAREGQMDRSYFMELMKRHKLRR